MAKKLSKDEISRIKNEIVMAEKFNEEELEPVINESLKRYTGQHYPGIGRNWDILVNEFYPIVQFNLPSTFLYTPQVFLKPKHKFYITQKRNPVTGKKEDVQVNAESSARTQEAILNYRLEEMGYKRETRKVVLDSLLFPHAILWHGYKGDFGMTEENSYYIKDEQTFVKHIPPMEFLKDPCVRFENIDEARWVARRIWMPLEELLEDDTLDVDKKQVVGVQGFGQGVGGFKNNGGMDKKPLNKGERPLIEFADDWFQNSKCSKFVKVYEVYLRPGRKQKREGSKGKILLLTDEQDKPLRESEWTIKAEGFPSKVLMFNPVPEAQLGMSDIDTYKSNVDQLNAIKNIQLRNATENSKVWVAIARDGIDSEEDIEKISLGDQTILMFPTDNISGKMQLASPSGMASSELYIIDQRIKKDIEEVSGVSDLKRGLLQSGEESATSVRIRTAGGNARPEYRRDIMGDFIRESAKYILQLEKQFLTIKDAVRIIGTLGIEWSENPSKEEIQAEVDVDLDVYSMLPDDPERELRAMREVLVFLVQAVQDPAIFQKIQQEGKTINLSPLIEKILMRLKIRNPEIFRPINPEENQGYASIEQLREAEQNVIAALQGAQDQIVPPQETDDHRVKIEIYSVINNIINAMQQKSDLLEQLIVMQQALLEEQQSKEGQEGQVVSFKNDNVRTL